MVTVAMVAERRARSRPATPVQGAREDRRRGRTAGGYAGAAMGVVLSRERPKLHLMVPSQRAGALAAAPDSPSMQPPPSALRRSCKPADSDAGNPFPNRSAMQQKLAVGKHLALRRCLICGTDATFSVRIGAVASHMCTHAQPPLASLLV
jgi:hypothetical protein